MTFKRSWFSNKIISSDGYYVRTIGRGAILYKDKKNKIYVSAERLASRTPAWALYPGDMRRRSEFGRKVEDDHLRNLIVERIKAVFVFLGWQLDVS